MSEPVKLFDVGDVLKTNRNPLEVVAVSEHVRPDGSNGFTYHFRDQVELDQERQEQADREAAEIQAQKDAEAEAQRVADLHEQTHDPELKKLTENDQDRLDSLQAGGIR